MNWYNLIGFYVIKSHVCIIQVKKKFFTDTIIMVTNFIQKDIAEVLSTSIVQQTAFWSEVKHRMGVQSIACDFRVRASDIYTTVENGQVIASDMVVELKPVGAHHTVAYVPYGPELEPYGEFQGAFLEELSECLRPQLPEDCIMIRYDLAWESWWANDENAFTPEGIWTGPPAIQLQELRFNIGTHQQNFHKAPSNILPSNTIFLDLSKNKTDMLMSMKPKTRYNIILSQRKGVAVNASGIDDLDKWYSLYRETALRNGFVLHSIDYFRAVLTSRAQNTLSPAEVYLLIAEHDNQPLAAMFLVITGNRGTYLYGASSSQQRNLMATYALQWKAICLAKEKGCTEYDMFGISPNPDPDHPLYGLYRFKSGFGGHIYHAMGCWDYPLQEEVYSCYTVQELNSQGYHIN